MRDCTWGDICSLEYGKALRGYPAEPAEDLPFRVYGTNGPIGWTARPLLDQQGIIVGRKGAYRGVHYSPAPFFVIDTAFFVRLKYDIDTKWAYYKLLTVDINRIDVGAAIPTTSRDAFYNLPLNVPSKEVQQSIAAILSTYDDLIENNRRRMALLEDAARQVYQEWFVRLRFPGAEHTRIVDGVPEGWERAPLESALVLQRGFDLPSQDRSDGSVPIYASTGVNGTHNVAKAKAPGIVTGRSGSLGKVHYVHEDYWPLNTTLWVKEFRRVSPLFAFFLLSSLQLDQYNGGVSVPTLDRKVVHQIKVVVPNSKIQSLFGDYVLPMFSQLRNLSLYNDKLRSARDLLLPKLMSGEISV